MASRTYNYCFNPDDDDVECFLIQIDCMIKSLNIGDEDGKKRALIESLSTKALKQLLMHLHPIKWDAESTTLDIMKDGLRKMYKPQVNKWVAREYFNHRTQREDENVEDYAVALKDMANYCDFGTDYESRIMEKLSVGLRNDANRQAMFSFYGETVPDIDITLEKAIEKAIAIEATTNIPYMFNHQGYEGYDTGQVGMHPWGAAGPKIPSNWKCWRCGECDHAAETCWVKTQICPICREYGHIPQMCPVLLRTGDQGRIEYSEDGQPMEKILDYIKISQTGGPRRGGRGGPIQSPGHMEESILQYLQPPMQNQRQFQGRGRIPSLPHVQIANDMGYDTMRGPGGRGSMPHPAFGVGKQRNFPQNVPDFDESDIEYDQNHLSPPRGGRPFRGRGGSRFSPARVEEIQTDYLQATHPAGRSDRLQGNSQLSAGGGRGPVRGSVSQAQSSSVSSSRGAAENASNNMASTNQGPHTASTQQGAHAPSAQQGAHAPSGQQGAHAPSGQQGPSHASSAQQGPHIASTNESSHSTSANHASQATHSSKSLSQAQLAESISKSFNQAPPQFTDKSSKQFMSHEPEVHHTLPKQNKQMNNLLGEMQQKHKNWRGSKSLSPSDRGDEVYEKDKFRSLPGKGRDSNRHSWGGSELHKNGSMTSEGETDESIDQMYSSLGNVDGRTNIVALDLHSSATAAVPTDAKVPNKNKALRSSPSRVKPFKLLPSAFAPFEPVIPASPTPPPRVRGKKHSKDLKLVKDSIVKTCSEEESELIEDKEQSKEDSKSIDNSNHSKDNSKSIDSTEISKEDSESVCTESQSKSIEQIEVEMTAVTNSEEKKPSPKTRPDQPPLPARAPRITVPNMKSPEPNSELPPSSPSTPPPPPPPPPSDYDCIASPAPPDLPPPPEHCRSNSPPPPPPPPSYHPSEVSGDELPPPPIPTHQQEATLEFPPPPPSIVESKKDHTKASGPALPTPPTPPPRHSRIEKKTENDYICIKENEEESIDKPDLPPPPARVLRGIDAFFPDDAICNQVIQETDEEYEEEFLTDITDTDDEVFHEALDELPIKFRNSNQSNVESSDMCSLDSSSTLTATLLLTQASDVSPLPPHALRVSPVPTEEATNLSSPDCTTVTDDRTITPLSDFTPVSNLFDMSKDSTLDMETPAPTPQLSETPVTTGEYSPDLQKISSPSIEEFDSKAGSDISLPQSPSETLCSETISTLTPEMSDVDRISPSLSSTNATRAQMSSPMSIDTPTLFSLPTDTSRISVEFDSLVDDTLTIDTSSFNTSSQNHFLASCSEFTDSTSRRSVDSALGSAPLSPAYTGSCTITPMPTDNTLTPMSTNPTTTPIPSPIPTEVLYPTPPSSLQTEAFVSPWQSFSNSASVGTSSIQEDLTPTELKLETVNVQNVINFNEENEESSNNISITESNVNGMDVKDINSSDQNSILSLKEEVVQKESYFENVKDINNMDSLNDQGNEKIDVSNSLTSTTKLFNAEVSNGENEQIEKIVNDVLNTSSELTTSLSEVKNKENVSVVNDVVKGEDMKTIADSISNNQVQSSVEPSSKINQPSLALLSVISPETKPSLKSKTRSSLTSTSSVESTSSLTSISSLSTESNTVSSIDSVKSQKKEKAKPDVIVKELGARNSLTDQIVRELGKRQKSEDRSHSQDTLKKINKPPITENIPSSPFAESTPPGSPATLRKRGRPNYLPRGSPEPHLEILSIPDPPTPPPRRNKLGSSKTTPEASKCDLSLASSTKVGGFVPRPPQRSNTLPIIPLKRNSLSGKPPTSSSTSPLPSTSPVPIPGTHNKSPRSPISVPGKPEKSSLSSSPSIRSLIDKGGARMKSLSPLRNRNSKNISPARSSSPIRWVHSPIPSSPQSPITAAPKSPEQAINLLDNIMDSLGELTSNLPNSPPPESMKSGQVFFPQEPISSNEVKQDSIEDVEIPWRKKRSQSGVDTSTDSSKKTPVTKQVQSQQEKVDQIRQKKDSAITEEFKTAENSCDSTQKETRVTFTSNSRESRIHDDATTTPPPVSHRSKTPPLPPPRSTTTTPKPSIGLGHVPAPPVRQYMLVPINHPLAVNSARSTPARQLSPPPAPLRSSSIRKTSPPPPPNRSRSQTPVGWLEWTEQKPPLPPPPLPISACTSATPTPLKLTPVPEESDSRSPSDQSQSPQSPQSADEENAENTVSKQTPKDFSNKPSIFSGFVGKIRDIAVSKSSDSTSSAEPPRIPPPPSDDVECELPPPPPPPPSDTTPEEEKPLPPPLPSDIAPLSIQRIPTPPPRNKIVTPALPPLPNIPLNSSPLSPQLPPPELPPPPVEDLQTLNNINNFLSAEPDPGNTETSDMPSEPFLHEMIADKYYSKAVQSVCPTPPPPPPPPPPKPPKDPLTESSSPTSPLLSISPYGRVVVNRTDLPPPTPEEEIRKVFKNAKDWAWLDELSDTLAVYTQLRPTMQQGPQCGLVALSMASQIFPETWEVDTILNMAKDRGYTSHGEMFSAEKMAQLASEISGVEASVQRDVLSNPKILLQTLLQGDLILVPYDADGNHQPTNRKGHKAHWGVITGVLVQCPGLNVTMGGAAKIDTQVDHLYHLRPKNRAGLPGSARRGGGGTTPVSNVSPHLTAPPVDARLSASPLDGWGTPDKELWDKCTKSRVSTPQLQSLPNDDMTMVVLWRQGKSRNIIASTLDALCESNDQLEEYTPPANEREYDALEFLEPGSCCVVSLQQKLP